MISLPVWLPGPMFLLGRRGLCPWFHVPSGGLCSRGFLSRGESEKRAVHILLESLVTVEPVLHNSHMHNKQLGYTLQYFDGKC